MKSPDKRSAAGSASGGRHSPTAESSVLLVRFSGDLTTKAPATRRRMTSRLIENLRTSIKLAGREGRVVRDRNRLFVELTPLDSDTGGDIGSEALVSAGGQGAGRGGPPDDAAMATRLARVFGVQSVSLAKVIGWSSLEDIVEAGVTFGAPFVRDRRFSIRARRVGDRHATPVRSGDIERALGERLLRLATRVDLSNPEATVFVEVDPERAYLFAHSERGAGGLPLGTEGRAVSLISGGFDSPVASWRLLRRGVSIDYVFCNLGGRQHELETLTIAKCLADRWQVGTRPRFHAIDFDAMSREIQAKVATRFWQVVLKRMMLRAAEAVADSWDAGAIVTGEAIGQVSSQTLQNLSVISEGARYPILRPVIGNNKDEIIAESKIVGTHDLSAKVGEYCALVPSGPATHAKLDEVLAEEAKLDPLVLDRALEARCHFNLNELNLDSWESEDLSTREIQAGDTVIDLRDKAAYTTWHYPDALYLDFPNALRAYGTFDSGQRYVLYCELGLKSAHLADLMRRAGLRARHVSGGLREIRRLAGNAR